MIISPKAEFRKLGTRLFVKLVVTTPDDFVASTSWGPVQIFYSEFNKDSGVADITITEKEFNSASIISEDEWFNTVKENSECKKTATLHNNCCRTG